MEVSLRVFSDGDEKEFSQRGRECLEGVRTLLAPISERVGELLTLGHEAHLFSPAHDGLWGEDFAYIDFSFSDPSNKNFRSRDLSDEDNVLLGIPPIYKQIMGPHQTISVDTKFLSVLRDRFNITPKQWAFFMLLGLGFAGYQGRYGTFEEILKVDEDRMGKVRIGIERLDDFALQAMRILGINVDNLGNPFQYLKSGDNEDINALLPLEERGARLQRAIEFSQ